MKRFLIFLCCFAAIAQENNQTLAFAKNRSTYIGHVDYHLGFDIQPDSKTYEGFSYLSFELTKEVDQVVVDFSGEEIPSITINGDPAKFQVHAKRGIIEIDSKGWPVGKHILKINFVGTFRHGGAGLHQFKDPEDGREYFYTDFEPQDAHRAFPCFDQPDLKATFEVTVTCPTDWTVISNSHPDQKWLEDKMAKWHFPKTLPFSTYLFQLSVGPYASWHDNEFRVPLGIYCRQSLAKYMDQEHIFETTRKGFDYFEPYFDMPYPFGKYDQIFVPEFNAGAMENVGAVTFNEGYIWRSLVTLDRVRRRDGTILHEMAHMWFGDIVTMEWWDDLWLNESFATNMATRAIEAIGYTEFTANNYSGRNYIFSEDQNPASHPILAEVPDIRTASSIFDSITYGKGSAVLFQFGFYLGEDTFRDGVRHYLKENAYQNATFHDFLGSMEIVSGQKLEAWRKAWFETQDVNSLSIVFEAENGVIKNAKAIQDPGLFDQTLRPHACEVGLFDLDPNGNLKLREAVRIKYDGKITNLPQLNGKKVPTVLIPNYNDRDYVKSQLDPGSLEWVQNHLGSLGEGTTKTMIWRILSGMVWDLKLDNHNYLEMATQALFMETDYPTARSLRSNVYSGIYNLPTLEEQDQARHKIWLEAHKRLPEELPNSDWQRFWFDIWQSTAVTPMALEKLKDFYRGDLSFQGLELNSTRKWEVIQHLANFGDPLAMEWAQVLAEEDQSQPGKLNMLALPYKALKAEKKAEAWDRILNDDSLSLYEKRSIASAFNNSRHPELFEPYIEKYFETLPIIFKEKEWEFVDNWCGFFYPTEGEEKTVQLTEEFLSQKDLAPALKSSLESSLFYLKKHLEIKKGPKMKGS